MKLTPKERLLRLLKSVDRVVAQMDHPDLSSIVQNWNGSRNLRENLAEFSKWQKEKL